MITSIKNSPIFLQSKDLIHSHLRDAFTAVKEYMTVFEPFRQIYLKNSSNVHNIAGLFESGDVELFQNAIAGYKGQIDQFRLVPRYADVGVLFVDSVDMKLAMMPSPVACLASIRAYLPELVLQCAQELVDKVGAMNPVIAGEPNTVEAYVNKKKVKDAANAGLEGFNERQSYIRSLVHVMDDNTWPAPDQVKALMRMLKESLVHLESNVQLAEGKEEEETKKFSLQVTEETPKVIKKLGEVREQLDANLIGDVDASDEKVVKFLAQQEADFAKLKARLEKIQEYQVILKLPVDDFEMVEEVGLDLNLKVRLWNDRVEWTKLRQRILDSPINSLDCVMLEKELAKYNKTVQMTAKGLPLNKVVPRLKASVDEINPVLPIVMDLRNPCLKDRHWEKINTLVGFNMQESESFSLFDLIDKGVTRFQEDISVIATSAQQESILEEMMAKVTGIWEKLVFDVKPYKEVKDLYILGDTSEVIASLDDSLVTINTVLGSRYVSGIRTFVDTWRSKLMHFQETLDEWLTCQRNWMYLETIFGSADIIRQLPGPAKTFQAVDKSWKMIMKATNEDNNALKAGTHDKTRKDTFKSHNANLDQIQKDLEDYLETKRMAFPRFYFLSNDELLEILSQAKEPRAVQAHLRKCFDNLVKLEFGSEPGSIDILAMFSSENERVSLGKNLKARGNVEEWLTAVEKKMKESLHGYMKAGLIDYDTKPRDEWIADHPGQIVATVAQMTWARETERVLRSDDPIAGMKQWALDYKAELQKLIVKIRGALPKLVRYIIVALVTTDVHARDIIDELCEREVRDVHDFLWQQQLRYYWDLEIDDCMIKHSDAKVNYGYEYMGATSRLVITPLTDRCWLTLTGSYALKLGAAPAGPAGTGKTESSKGTKP
jgi:dynein heavy chain